MLHVALIPLACPNCTAPVDGPGVCRFCGVTLVADTTAASRREERFFVALRVGPSNHERVVRLLEERAGLDGAAARTLLTQSPCELALGSDRARASEIARAAFEAGAQAEVISRSVAIPIVRVVLDAMGANKIAVIVALRAHVELSVAEAKWLVASVPALIAAAMDEPEAQALVAALENAGARAHCE